MWDSVDLDTLSVVNDLGVGWRHNSNPFRTLRLPQLCEEPVAAWPIEDDAALVSFQSDEERTAPLGISDPLARELYLSSDLRDQARAPGEITTPEEARATSILRVHEPLHAGLADRFTQYYGYVRFVSFNHSLRIVQEGPHLSVPKFYRNLLDDVFNVSWQFLRGSASTQEAIAIGAQRAFLDQYDHSGRDPGWRNLLATTQYHRYIDRYLEEGIHPSSSIQHDSVEKILEHMFGDWMANQIRSKPWKIDPSEFAFRIGLLPDDDDPGGIIKPDKIFQTATAIPANDLVGLDKRAQLDLLFSRVEKRGNMFGRDPVQVGAPRVEDPPYQTMSPEALFDHRRSLYHERAVDVERWSLIPLLATTYPNRKRTVDTTLWDLLDGLVADVVGADGRVVRRLWLESQYDWARGTPLLWMARRLWRLRDTVLLPLIRIFQNSTSHNINAVLETARALADNNPPPDLVHSQTNVTESPLEAKIRDIHAQLPALQDQYSDLLKALETLGKAIYEEDEKKVAAFYRS